MRREVIIVVFVMFMLNMAVAQKPNIVLIMADDMGFSDIGCYGGEVKTPNLDKLASGGIRFREFYNGARCCPTRASLMTGLYPHQTGIGHMTNTPQDSTQHNYGLPGYMGYLNKECVTIGEMLKMNGYQTLMTGKWHLGHHGKDKWPLQRGFDKYYGILSGGTNYFKPEEPRGLTYGNDPVEPKGDNFYITDAFTDKAIDFVKEADPEKPFFLYLAYTAPHWPLHAFKEDIDKYRGKYMQGWTQLREQRLAKMKEIGVIADDVQLSEQAGPDWDSLSDEKKKEMDLRRAIYSAQIDRMDQNIGNLIDCLEKSGKMENTLIIFLSDNGGCAEGGMLGGGKTEDLESDRGWLLSYGEAWANASNTPFRMYKHWVNEGGISTPLIIHWPAGIPESMNGTWLDQFGFIQDIAATIKEVTNAPYPEKYNGNKIHPLVGNSIFPAILEDKPIHKKPVFWEHEGNCAMRKNNYKLVKIYKQDWELFDMKKDRAESHNLIEGNPELAKKMEAQYKKWMKQNNVVGWNEIKEIIARKKAEKK